MVRFGLDQEEVGPKVSLYDCIISDNFDNFSN